MKILVKVKTGAREERVKKIGENEFAVSVHARPEKGKANQAVMRALADYFGVGRNQIKIITGHTSRKKLVAIMR